jgi:hypothetical protein
VIQEWIQAAVDRAGTLCETLNRSQKFYFFGATFLVLTLFWAITPFTRFAATAGMIAVSLFVGGMLSDILDLYVRAWRTTIGKAVFLVLYALLSAISYGAAKQVVNIVVGFDPQFLGRTVTVVAILLLPAIAVAVLFAIFGMLFAVGQFYVVALSQRDLFEQFKCLKGIQLKITEPYPLRTFFVRIFVYSVVVWVLLVLTQSFGPSYGRFLERATENLAYHLEGLRFSECQKPQHAKVIPISGDRLILATRVNNGVRFEPIECRYRDKPNKAMQPTPQSGAADG